MSRVWGQQFETVDGRVAPRERVDVCGAEEIHTPHAPDVRYGAHGGNGWEGYLMHWTETAAPDQPRIITDVATTPAGVADCRQLDGIQARLASRALLPDIHRADKGYVTGDTRVASTTRGVQLLGPVQRDSSPQAQIAGGLTADQFQVDFERERAVCPAGVVATIWSDSHNR